MRRGSERLENSEERRIDAIFVERSISGEQRKEDAADRPHVRTKVKFVVPDEKPATIRFLQVQ